MAAARASADPRDRLVVELLARTGMRAGELAGLDADAVVLIGAGHWLRIPLGKLRNDRYVPLHPELVELLTAWTAANLEHIRRHKRLIADHRGPLDRYLIGRVVARVGRAAGVPGVHPHRLRHTLATQAINRGMRLEAIAALLGHRKMEMTLIYARIANRVVADEYAAVSAKIDALYGQPPQLPADYETTGMARLRREAHARMLGNGLCGRPADLDCRLESACETCATSAPAPSSCPSWSASATTPATTARPTGPSCSTASSSAPKPDPPPPDGADRHAPHHPRPQRRRRARRDSHLPRRLAIRQPETDPRRQPDRLRRPPRLRHRHPVRRPAPLHLPPRRQRRRRTLRRADTVINNTRMTHHALDKITRITPILYGRSFGS